MSVTFGPRLIANPTATLRAAVLVRPTAAIANAKPLQGEPNAIYVRALEQHDVLVRTLQFFGVETTILTEATEDPYECAVANAAVTFENGVFLTRPTSIENRSAVDRLESALTRHDIPVAGHIAAPGFLDGGDVLLVRDIAFIGVSETRGNTLGRTGFATVAAAHGCRAVEVRLRAGVPSLRSLAGAVAHDTIVASADSVDTEAFVREGFTVITVDRGQDFAAGVLPLGERHVLTDTRYATALGALRKAGIIVESIDLYDFMKAGLTPSMLVLALKRG